MSRAMDDALKAATAAQLRCRACNKQVQPYEFPFCDGCCDQLFIFTSPTPTGRGIKQ